MHDEERRPTANHLPLDIMTFINRQDERARFADCVLDRGDRTEPRIILVSGGPGSGRTTLAVKAIKEHVARSGTADQFDLLHFRVKGSGPRSTTDPEAIIDQVLADLGVPQGDEPGGLPEKHRRLRSVTKDRRVVILLDDVVLPAQVRAVVPGNPDSLLVVTTAEPFSSLRDQRPGNVQVLAMPTAHVVAQLRAELQDDRRVDAEPGALWELARRCHGLPLCATVAAGRLSADPFLRIAGLVEEIKQRSSLRVLGAGEDEETSLKAILDAGYDGLDDAAKLAYRAAGLHPTPSFDVWAIAAAIGVPAAEARGVLALLCSAGLLTRDTRMGGHRYGINPAVHEHAADAAQREGNRAERDSVLAGFAAYYVHAGLAADAVLTPRWQLGTDFERPPVLDLPVFATGSATGSAGDADGPDARQWSGANIQAIVALVGPSRGGDEPLIGTRGFAAAMALATDGYFRGTGMSPDRQLLLAAGLADAENCGHVRVQARIRNQLGFGCLETEDWDSAEGHFTGALELSASDGDGPGQGGALEALGILAGRRGRYADALAAFDRALPFLQAMGRTRSIALIHLHRGRALIGSGRSAEALELLEHAWEMLRAERERGRPDPVNEGKVLLSTSDAFLSSGTTAAAHAKAEQALELFTGQGALVQRGQAFEALGRSAPTDGERTGHLRSAIDAYEAVGNEKAAQRVRKLLDGR
ncbi:tetratricopeptide repeat protein [Murinocardiopsis flavida]|uniref:tetratricopeptide repeat protein n=1 Tax=Murinocardiopsis flavida TaxID=645275 RepID=UPI000D0CAB9A|nr:tetratricopeptide repeat protein [Murinocardiopsis flavida]